MMRTSLSRNTPPVENRLLKLLSDDDAQALLFELEPVDLPKRKTVLAYPNTPIEHVYFLDEGIASVVASSPEGLFVEAGFIGRDGFVVPAVALGSDRLPHLVEIQLPGSGRRIKRERFLQILDNNANLRSLCLRFAQVLMVQAAHTALSNAVHEVDERLARWLLMCHDRSNSDDIPLTHDFMSIMLGVRRSTVTTALHVLEGNGFIKAERGSIQIIKRAALEEFAGDSYGTPESEYRRLLGPL